LSSVLKAKLELKRLASEWRFWAERIAEATRNVLGLCEVYVFGSVAEGRATGASDVDILIVCSKLPKDCRSRGEFRAEIEEKAGLPLYHPFEIHLADELEASWYLRHVKRMIQIG